MTGEPTHTASEWHHVSQLSSEKCSSICYTSLSAMFNLLRSISNQELFKKHLCNPHIPKERNGAVRPNYYNSLYFHAKNFRVKIFLYDYVNQCSIKVVQSCIKKFHERNFRTNFAYKNYFTTKKRALYGISIIV